MTNTVFALAVMWTLDPACLDVLETSNEIPPVEWCEVAGPYRLDLSRQDYLVPIEPEQASQFFRVRRVWGVPWLADPVQGIFAGPTIFRFDIESNR